VRTNPTFVVVFDGSLEGISNGKQGVVVRAIATMPSNVGVAERASDVECQKQTIPENTSERERQENGNLRILSCIHVDLEHRGAKRHHSRGNSFVLTLKRCTRQCSRSKSLVIPLAANQTLASACTPPHSS
jgi:hypothetical protein